MKEFSNNKGFLILEISQEEIIGKLKEYGLLNVGCACGLCHNSTDIGFYVAAINRWLCLDCFYEWYIRAERNTEDIPIEERNYERYKSLFR